ncbi:MAG TPA: ATP-binding protein [Steroidobacteraceae bacterium]|nr:ATP-binding protein [Steroidobacteraceae bacterium]
MSKDKAKTAKKFSSRMQGARAVWVAVGILALAFLVGVLAPAWYFAGRLVENNTAVRAIGELQQQPSRMQAALNSIQDRLRARGFVRDSIEQLKRATQQFETSTASLQSGGGVSIGGFGGDDDVQKTISEMTDAWKKYQPALAPVANFSSIPYSDSEREGTQLNMDGRELQRSVTNAATQARVYTPALEKSLAQIIAGLQSSSDSLATALRSVVLIGVGLAAALAALVGYLSLARGKQAAAAQAARQQTEDILRTVREGLFLLDADLKIGEIHSDATGSLFQRESIAGITFEDLLRNLVSAKTLAIATKFVKVLWSERTKENLIRSINPLNEVEVITGGDGKQDKGETHYLEFNFHRVRRDGAITHVLVSVSDVTARVALAAQLKGAQDNAQTQMDAFLSILHVDPNQLSSFLDDSDVAFKMINATLRDPARDSASFRRKIDGLFRQIHSIKGEASAIGLGSMEQRAHALESDLAALRERTDLTGDDFLPLLTKFDDLVSHSQSVREMVTKLASFRDSFAPKQGQVAGHATGATGSHAAASTGDTSSRQALTADAVAAEATLQRSAREGFVASAQQLADRIANDHGKKVVVTCRGHDQVPETYRRPVKDVLIQLIRNAVVHGIESPQEREAAGKSPEGHIRINFEMTESGRAFRMQCEDDGRGLTPDKLRKTAVTKGIISQNDAAALSDQEAMMLVFRSGFSTATGVTRDAGRGVGMDVIAEIAARLGGRISLNSEVGKNMRLSLSFPSSANAAGVVAA